MYYVQSILGRVRAPVRSLSRKVRELLGVASKHFYLTGLQSRGQGVRVRLAWVPAALRGGPQGSAEGIAALASPEES